MKIHPGCHPFLITALIYTAGCATQEDEHQDEATSELQMTGRSLYDAGTLCTVGGVTMHCCPDGWVMIGASVSKNNFKCGELSSPPPANRVLDVSTLRNNMHACPPGMVMVGLSVSKNNLACQSTTPAETFEYVDGNPPLNDSFPMHICPSGYAMAGISVSLNLFNCDF